MTGLEKIKNQILEEAGQKASDKRSAAEAKAEEILNTARDQAGRIAAQMEERSAADAKNYRERIKSSCDLKRRTMILEAKQEIISQVIEKAYQSLQEADAEEYFSMMEKLLCSSVQKGDGKMYLSAKDLERMPKGFADQAAEIARDKGGTLVVEKEAKAMDGGFILVYGGIEENCTWRALFDANHERLQDIAHEYLWRDENG
jgi:V/A-type H+-transporting ATPase subunit E